MRVFTMLPMRHWRDAAPFAAAAEAAGFDALMTVELGHDVFTPLVFAALATERNFFVLEDGVYSDVRFDDSPIPPPLRSLAPGHVIYCDSLSKTVGGGLRMGWIAARWEKLKFSDGLGLRQIS